MKVKDLKDNIEYAKNEAAKKIFLDILPVSIGPYVFKGIEALDGYVTVTYTADKFPDREISMWIDMDHYDLHEINIYLSDNEEGDEIDHIAITDTKKIETLQKKWKKHWV